MSSVNGTVRSLLPGRFSGLRAWVMRHWAWVMAGCVSVAALLAIGETVVELRRPFQMDYGEGVILNSAVRILHGQPLYPDPHAYPTVLNPYGPVGYYLAAACVSLGGVSFVYPRLLMLGCGLLVALLLVLLIEHWTGNWALAWAFGLFFVTMRATLLWWPLLRFDLLAMAISLGGFLVWLRAPDRWWPLATVLFAMALFVKPTALPIPAACCLSRLAERQWTSAPIFGPTGSCCSRCSPGGKCSRARQSPMCWPRC